MADVDNRTMMPWIKKSIVLDVCVVLGCIINSLYTNTHLDGFTQGRLSSSFQLTLIYEIFSTLKLREYHINPSIQPLSLLALFQVAKTWKICVNFFEMQDK
jgi:hypothetical protein